MQLFDASKGLFHLLFVNSDDSFFTDSYVRARLNFFLYHRLVSMKYEYIYVFSGADHSGFTFTCPDNISARAYDDKNSARQKPSFFGMKKQSAFSPDNSERLRSGRKSIYVPEQELSEVFGNLISLTKRKSRVAVIIPIGIFNMLAGYPEICEELAKINSRNYQDNNRHIFVITASKYSGESLPFFKPSTETSINGNVFSDSRLFPELEEYYNDLYGMTRNFYIYDELRSFLGDKAVFYESLSYENIRRMCMNIAINTGFPQEMSIKSINALAAVIYTFYNSAEYRNNSFIPLPENPKRSLSEIEAALRNNRKLRAACVNAMGEFLAQDDPYKYAYSVYSDCCDSEAENFMIGGADNADELDKLMKIRRICASRLGKCDPSLEKAIRLLSKPCTDSTVSFSAASFRKRIIEMTYNNISDEMNDTIDTELISFMLRGLDYYFDYFRSISSLTGDAVSAKDISFDFYKDIMYLAEKRSSARLSREVYKKKLDSQLENGDDVSAESTRQYLEKTDAFIRTLDRTIEQAENMLSSPVTQTNARGLITKMKAETNHLKELEKEKEPEYKILN